MAPFTSGPVLHAQVSGSVFEDNAVWDILDSGVNATLPTGRRETSRGGGCVFSENAPQAVTFGTVNVASRALQPSVFRRCVAKGHGGAVLLLDAYELSVNMVTFEDNYATDTGGAIAYMASGTNIEALTRGSFIGNGSTFVRNQAGMYERPRGAASEPAAAGSDVAAVARAASGQGLVGGANPEGSGGAVFAESSRILVDCALFEDNAAVSGGALFARGMGRVVLGSNANCSVAREYDGVMHNVVFEGNSAAAGGAIAAGEGVVLAAGVTVETAARVAAAAVESPETRKPQDVSQQLLSETAGWNSSVLLRSNTAVSGAAWVASAAY